MVLFWQTFWEVPELEHRTSSPNTVEYPPSSDVWEECQIFPAMHWRSGSTFTMRGSSAVSAHTSACVWRILSVPELTRVVLNRKTTNWQRNQWCERCADWACKLIKECSRKDRTERQTEWQGAEDFPLCLVEGTEIALQCIMMLVY